MNRHRLLLFVMAVVSFVLLWEAAITSKPDGSPGNAWAAQPPNETPPTILSPGRNLGPIGISLRITDERLIISRGEPNKQLSPHTTSLKFAAHFPTDTGERGVHHNPVAKRAPAAENKSFEFKDGLLTLEASQRPLSEILAQVSEAAGVVIIVFDPIDSVNISVSVKDRPLQEALRTILKGYSHSVVYNPKRESQGVRIVQQPKTHAQRNEQNALPVLGTNRGATESALPGRAASQGAAPGAAPSEVSEKGEGSLRLASNSIGAASAGTEGSSALGAAEIESSAEQAASAAAENASVQNPQARGMTPEQKLQRLIAMYEQRIASGVSDKEYEINMKLSGGGYVVHDRDRIEFWQEALNRHAGR